jgi:putative transposase
LLAERNIVVSYESIRLWVNKFGPEYTRRLRRKHTGFGDTYFLAEVFVKILRCQEGKQHYLWRAVDQDGEVVDVYLQARRDAKAAKRFFQRFLKAGGNPREIVTDIRFADVTLSYFDFDHSRFGTRLQSLSLGGESRMLHTIF